MKRLLISVLSLFFGLVTAAERPNIIYILADDLGWGDLSCYGQATIKTPNLDKLASDGIRFTRHYSGSTVCAPSRCVLMTGLHTGHCRVRGNGSSSLKQEDYTVAEFLKANGYRTGCFGKWGIGNPPPIDDPGKNGFDEFYGYVNMFHAHNFYPEFLVRNGIRERLNNVTKPSWKERGREDRGPKEGAGVAMVKNDYAPELIFNEAIQFIETNKEKPFFLYYALNTPHANNEGGSDKVQQDGMEVPHYGEYANEDWPNPEKGFATMIRHIDDQVGSFREVLESKGISKNTLIIFSSDNGPHQEGRHFMEFFDSNGRKKGMKRDLTDGGIRVPMIAYWPGKIKPGGTTDHLSGFQDLLPTVSELIEAELPDIALDGISFLPTLLGKKQDQRKHKYLYWEFIERGGKIAVTTTKWKAIRRNANKSGPAAGELALYDLVNDPEEEINVAKKHPEIVKRMARWMKESHTELQ